MLTEVTCLLESPLVSSGLVLKLAQDRPAEEASSRHKMLELGCDSHLQLAGEM